MIIASAANEKYFIGLYVSLISMARALPQDKRVRFHVVDGGLKKNSIHRLEKDLSHLLPKMTLVLDEINASLFEGFPDMSGDRLTYARLLLPDIIPEDRVIYLDADLLCNKNFETLWEIDLKESPIAAAQDQSIRFLKNDMPPNSLGVNPETPYFNPGIALLDLDRWRREGLSKDVMKYIQSHAEYCKYWDQSALNAVFQGDCSWLEDSWNVPSFVLDQKPDMRLGSLNIHYLSWRKPWLYYGCEFSSQLYYVFLKKFAIDVMDAPWRKMRFLCKHAGVLSFLFTALSKCSSNPKWIDQKKNWISIQHTQKKCPSNRINEWECFLNKTLQNYLK